MGKQNHILCISLYVYHTTSVSPGALRNITQSTFFRIGPSLSSFVPIDLGIGSTQGLKPNEYPDVLLRGAKNIFLSVIPL